MRRESRQEDVMGGEDQEPISRRHGGWIAVALVAVLLTFTAAATAITLKRSSHIERSEREKHTLPANFGVRPWGSGFEETLY
jgi:hypothetical protein